MGFLDNAKAAASNLAAKADTALAGATGGGAPRPGDADKFFRDLGVLTYSELTGRPVDAAERDRVLGALRDFDAQNALRFTLQTTPPPAPGMAGSVPPAPGMAGQMAPPPAPGMGGATPPPPMPGSVTPPPMPGSVPAAPAAPAPVAPQVEEAPPAPAAPATPPPPPSWA